MELAVPNSLCIHRDWVAVRAMPARGSPECLTTTLCKTVCFQVRMSMLRALGPLWPSPTSMSPAIGRPLRVLGVGDAERLDSGPLRGSSPGAGPPVE